MTASVINHNMALPQLTITCNEDEAHSFVFLLDIFLFELNKYAKNKWRPVMFSVCRDCDSGIACRLPSSLEAEHDLLEFDMRIAWFSVNERYLRTRFLAGPVTYSFPASLRPVSIRLESLNVVDME